jgi:molybdopterin molybdotransferase
MSDILSVKEAESIILNLVPTLDREKDTEIIKLDAALGRILAIEVISNIDFPYWDNSAMDGYAVKYSDVSKCGLENPVNLEVVEEIAAGYQPQIALKNGQSSRIFTGAMLPVGADTIVIQENTKKEGNQVKIFASPRYQEFVRHRASFYQAGNPLLTAGIALTESDIAILATAQCTQFKVYRRPKVAIFSTGDELIAPHQTLQSGKIVDSNQCALAAFVANNGGIPITMGIVPDRPAELKETILRAISQADLVLSTGGVSVGDYDYVEQILAELGGEIHIKSIAIKPGKPLTVATFSPRCLYFGIPGNPVSALVSCWRFVKPVLRKLSGLAGNWRPSFIKACSRHNLQSDGKRETYLWGKLSLRDGMYEFALAGGSHSSGNLINLAQTNGLAVIPVGQTLVSEGELVQVMSVTEL